MATIRFLKDCLPFEKGEVLNGISKIEVVNSNHYYGYSHMSTGECKYYIHCTDPQTLEKVELEITDTSGNEGDLFEYVYNNLTNIKVDDNSENYKYTASTCPKNGDWFVLGGRCGWAHECDFCEDNPEKENNMKEIVVKDATKEKITYKDLREKGACADSLLRVIDKFGDELIHGMDYNKLEEYVKKEMSVADLNWLKNNFECS